MLKVKHDLDKESAWSKESNDFLRKRAWQIVRVVSFNLEREAKFTLPVDTGRLRASWGHASFMDLDISNPRAFLSPADSVWKELERNLAIIQGSNVDYLQYVGANPNSGPQFRGATLDELGDKHQAELDRLTEGIIDELVRRL